MSIQLPPMPVNTDVSNVQIASDWRDFAIAAKRELDHITQLHANQTRTGMDQERIIGELRVLNETQMGLIEQGVAQRRSDEVLITNLRADLAARTQDIEYLRGDIRIISDELQSEAESREWCDEYRTFCRRVNGRLHFGRLGPDTRVFKVEHTYTVTVFGTVEAVDGRDAEEKADQQYGGIRESAIFSVPDDAEDVLDPERGEIINLRWNHSGTRAFAPGEE
jgi:hypothetical protein